jgi:hypothetical protein
MPTKFGSHSHRHLWRLALLLLVLLPFLPELAIYAATALAKMKGCAVDQKLACLIGPISVSGTIVWALETGLLRGASFSVGIAAAWLGLCYIVVSLGWAHMSSRLLLAFVVTVIFALLPYFGPMLALAHLVNPNCQPNEGGVGPCVIYGGHIGDAAHHAVTEPWLIFIGGPIAFGSFLVYVLVALVVRAAAAKREVRSPR